MQPAAVATRLGEPDDLVLEQSVLLVVEPRRERLDVDLPDHEQLVARRAKQGNKIEQTILRAYGVAP